MSLKIAIFRDSLLKFLEKFGIFDNLCVFIYVVFIGILCALIWSAEDFFYGGVRIVTVLFSFAAVLIKSFFCFSYADVVFGILFYGIASFFCRGKIGSADVFFGIFASFFLNVEFQILMILLESLIGYISFFAARSLKKIDRNITGEEILPFVPVMSFAFFQSLALQSLSA